MNKFVNWGKGVLYFLINTWLFRYYFSLSFEHFLNLFFSKQRKTSEFEIIIELFSNKIFKKNLSENPLIFSQLKYKSCSCTFFFNPRKQQFFYPTMFLALVGFYGWLLSVKLFWFHNLVWRQCLFKYVKKNYLSTAHNNAK